MFLSRVFTWRTMLSLTSGSGLQLAVRQRGCWENSLPAPRPDVWTLVGRGEHVASTWAAGVCLFLLFKKSLMCLDVVPAAAVAAACWWRWWSNNQGCSTSSSWTFLLCKNTATRFVCVEGKSQLIHGGCRSGGF